VSRRLSCESNLSCLRGPVGYGICFTADFYGRNTWNTARVLDAIHYSHPPPTNICAAPVNAGWFRCGFDVTVPCDEHCCCFSRRTSSLMHVMSLVCTRAWLTFNGIGYTRQRGVDFILLCRCNIVFDFLKSLGTQREETCGGIWSWETWKTIWRNRESGRIWVMWVTLSMAHDHGHGHVHGYGKGIWQQFLNRMRNLAYPVCILGVGKVSNPRTIPFVKTSRPQLRGSRIVSCFS